QGRRRRRPRRPGRRRPLAARRVDARRRRPSGRPPVGAQRRPAAVRARRRTGAGPGRLGARTPPRGAHRGAAGRAAPAMSALVIRGAEVEGRIVDGRIEADRVVDVTAGGSAPVSAPGDQVYEAGGGALLPGLHDHHIHLLALAAAARSVKVGPADVGDADGLARALQAADAALAPGRWLRAVGYHESVAGPLDLAAVGRTLLEYGVTGLTDATPTERGEDLALLAAAVADGALPQHLVVTGGPRLDPGAGPELERGPVKLVVADHRLPELDELVAAMAGAHRRGRPVAVHCVTHVALLLALAAWDEAGARPGDRLEHGAVVHPAEAVRIAAHGLTVVTQPAFVAERGDDYLADVEPDDRPHLWPCAGLLRAGIAVGGSTDAPFGPADPWQAIAAAT